MTGWRCWFGLHDWRYFHRHWKRRCTRCDRVERYAGEYLELDICDTGYHQIWVKEKP
jgi:hypothetical protein